MELPGFLEIHSISDSVSHITGTVKKFSKTMSRFSVKWTGSDYSSRLNAEHITETQTYAAT
jgi:hypothetical protein